MKPRIELQTVLTALCGLFMVVSFFPGSPTWIAYLSVAAGSYFALRTAYESVAARTLDVNILMLLAAIGAIVVGHADDAAVLLFLFSLSSTLEHLAMGRTKRAIEALVKLRPSEALLVEADGERTVPVESVRTGDRVRVRPFEQFPTDGEVISGKTSVNEAAMTGESVPVLREEGGRVLAGTQNLEGTVLVSVTAEVGDSTLDRIVSLVEQAQENKASGERLSHWFGSRYTLFVIAAFTVSLGVRLALGGAFGDALYRSLTLFVALSPCALVISIPASTLSALAWAARNGILTRGGAFIEAAGEIDAIAVDKTGTLTSGVPRLVEICVCSMATVPEGAACGQSGSCWAEGKTLSPLAAELLAVAAAAEQYSTHPIAQAIVTASRENNLDVLEASDHTVEPGLGVVATLDGERVRVGQLRMFEDGRLPEAFRSHVAELQDEGMTVAILEHRERYAAFGLRDQARPEAAAAVQELRSLGVRRIVMVTGDTEHTARAVAQAVGVEEVHAGLLPGDKTRIIEEMVASKHHVMMVGDGVNDAPSLATAHLGVAMGGLGSDVALEAADVVLMSDRLSGLSDLIRLGRRTRTIIRMNLLFAGGVIVALTLFSLFAKLPLPIAVIGHEGSTVIVILNGLRLLGGARAA
ncbi:MAG: cation-translocating P-type ATPase [Fimbriimonadaceae bacterium]|nr:cation-translocating P-type ATPase [Fimbriimonadaceae bacterium]